MRAYRSIGPAKREGGCTSCSCFSETGPRTPWDGPPAVKCDTSGTDWRAAAGPIVAADLLNGETYDAREETPGWTSPGFRAAHLA
ncbi:alpha-L-rhamnosidase N-terminal domain-containing protein [Streptomyces cellulosae]